LLGSRNIFLSIKLITKNKTTWIAIFISWFEKKSKIKEKTGIQTLKVNNKLLFARMLLFKILLH
jgi:hypothetical protein